MLSRVGDFIEKYLRIFIVFITNYLPVKVIRDDKGVPFLYRYHLFSLYKNGPGMCIHRFVKSDPERGYHDHPWNKSISFILCGSYEERIYDINSVNNYFTKHRNRFCFNYLDGVKTFHRVIVPENRDAWTLFAFQKRSKIWSMISLGGERKPMSSTIYDQDAGWWNTAGSGEGLHSHLEHKGKVIATVDIIVITNDEKVLLIKRGKEPYKDCWAFPGGRIELKDEDMLAAANRELSEETGLVDLDLQYVKTVGNSTRDPRGFCITNVFLTKIDNIPVVKAGDDAVDFYWFDLSNLPDMAFDHKEILQQVCSLE